MAASISALLSKSGSAGGSAIFGVPAERSVNGRCNTSTPEEG
ncbi:hypothetical protein [Amaricoccus sp.]|nr:hypothetical protein [Amaricoccus sp.]